MMDRLASGIWAFTSSINNILYYFGVNWHGRPLKVCLVRVVEIIRYYA